jgi:ribosomal protein S18 acetylase RimI-like enzyme
MTPKTPYQPTSDGGEHNADRRLRVAESISALMTFSFAADPPTRWIWPEPERHLEWFPRFVMAYAGAAIEHETVDAVEDGKGYAMWLSPGTESDNADLERLIRDSVPPARFDTVVQLIEGMGAFHPHEPVWFLPLIAVDPMWQGRGLGKTLLQQRLMQCDRDGIAAYLDSTNPKNLPFYQRLGFQVLGEVRAGLCPPVHPMLRKPQAAQI